VSSVFSQPWGLLTLTIAACTKQIRESGTISIYLTSLPDFQYRKVTIIFKQCNACVKRDKRQKDIKSDYQIKDAAARLKNSLFFSKTLPPQKNNNYT
jgi:hypothetical protein